MIGDRRHAFRVSFIMSEAPLPIPSALELVREVQSHPVWDGAPSVHDFGPRGNLLPRGPVPNDTNQNVTTMLSACSTRLSSTSRKKTFTL
jgi:hypothetical protein